MEYKILRASSPTLQGYGTRGRPAARRKGMPIVVCARVRERNRVCVCVVAAKNKRDETTIIECPGEGDDGYGEEGATAEGEKKKKKKTSFWRRRRRGDSVERKG